MKSKLILRTLLITSALLALSQATLALTYTNTQQEVTTFNDFVYKQKGTLICEAVNDGISYSYSVTKYVTFDQVRQKYLFSAYDNKEGKWLKRDVEVTVDTEMTSDNVAYFDSVDPKCSFEIGVGELSYLASYLGAAHISSRFPYAGGFLIQFHNTCRIVNN